MGEYYKWVEIRKGEAGGARCMDAFTQPLHMSEAGLDSNFSFSTSCYTKGKEFSLPYYLK